MNPRLPWLRAWLVLPCLLLAACGGSRSAARLDHAEQLRSAGDLRAALIEVRNVLQRDMENPRARWDFADLLYRTGDLEAAELELQRVQGLRTEVAVLQSRIRMARGHGDAALQVLEQAGLAPQSAASDDFNFAKADALLALGRYTEARALLEPAAARPDVRAQLRMARLLELQGDSSAAKSILAAATSQHPTYAPAWSMSAALALQQGDLSGAETAFSRAARADSQIDTSSDRIAALSGLVEARLARSDVAGARAALALLQLAAPNALVTGYTRAQLEVAAGDYNLASAQLEALVHTDRRNAKAWVLLGRLQAAQGYLEKAAVSLRQAIDAEPDHLEVRRQLAQLELRLARPDAAVEVLAPVLDADRSGTTGVGADTVSNARWSAAQLSAHAVLLAGHLAAGRKSQAAAELDAWPLEAGEQAASQVARLIGTSPPAARRLAADTVRQIAAASVGNAGLQLLAAALASQSGDSATALLGARRAVTARPGDAGIALAASEVMSAVGSAQEALDVLRQIRTGGAAAADISLAMSRAQLSLGNVAAARAALDAALGSRPQWMQALVLEVLIDVNQGQTQMALQRAQSLRSVFPNSAVPHALLGDILAARNDYQAAAQEYARAVAKSGQWQPVIREFQMRRAAQQADAEQPLMHWLAQHPNDYPVRQTLATYLAGTGRKAAAIAEFERLRQQRPDDAVVLNDLAWLYGEQGGAHAIELARQAVKLQPHSAAILDTLGWLLIQRGAVAEGLELVTRASHSDPNDLNIQFHRGCALVQVGDRVQGEATLRRLLATEVQFPQRGAAERLLESAASTRCNNES